VGHEDAFPRCRTAGVGFESGPWLSTTLAGPPPKLGYFDQNGDVQTFTERVTEYLSVTPLLTKGAFKAGSQRR